MIAILGFWESLAGLIAAMAIWAGPREMTPQEELKALILREQHPWRWARKYPAKAVERLFR
jgi:hypothetical protein